jgi:hypothetical protein
MIISTTACCVSGVNINYLLIPDTKWVDGPLAREAQGFEQIKMEALLLPLSLG